MQKHNFTRKKNDLGDPVELKYLETHRPLAIKLLTQKRKSRVDSESFLQVHQDTSSVAVLRILAR